jgi:GTP-binding protein
MSSNSEPSVAIVGRPNVGKSELFNRLVGRKIAIVHDQPGITRDRISALSKRGDRPFKVWDTGGVGGAGESQLLTQVRDVVQEAIRDSDVLLFVVDAQQGLSPIDQELARMLRRSRKPIVLVVNKIDHPNHDNLAIEFDSLGFDANIAISAAHGQGISELLEAIEKKLPLAGETEDLAPQTSSPVQIEHPIALAIVGRPNVGKSSLINSVLGSDRAIVSELAGTTRDSVDISYGRDGEQFTFIDTAGMRRRGQHSSSVEVFSVMRAERSIRRADLCVLIVDLSSGVTSQDKRIAGLMQKAKKASLVVLNKWDLIKPKRGERQAIRELLDETRDRLFFLDYAPVLIASARTGENIDKLFALIAKIQQAAQKRIGTGILNRILRAAFVRNPPPMVSNRRLKLFYATQTSGTKDRHLAPPEFVLFVNDPRLINETYARYLEARIREAEPYAGLPITVTLRPRTETSPNRPARRRVANRV